MERVYAWGVLCRSCIGGRWRECTLGADFVETALVEGGLTESTSWVGFVETAFIVWDRLCRSCMGELIVTLVLILTKLADRDSNCVLSALIS